MSVKGSFSLEKSSRMWFQGPNRKEKLKKEPYCMDIYFANINPPPGHTRKGGRSKREDFSSSQNEYEGPKMLGGGEAKD